MKKWDDVYDLPLRKDNGTGWVYDDNDNFVFQFQDDAEFIEDKLLDIINGAEDRKKPKVKFIIENGLIKTESEKSIILIRGWGNLTGTGAMNLPDEDAKNIQDTFAEFILSKLNTGFDEKDNS